MSELTKNQQLRLFKLHKNLSKFIAPTIKMKTIDWASKYLYTPSNKAMGGKVDLWMTPVIAKLVDLYDDPMYEQVWVIGGARCGKSFSTLAHLGNELTTRRRQVLDAWPNDNMIRRFIKNDFNDMIKASPIFKDILPDENAEKKAGNYKNKIFKNGAKLIEANMQSSNDMSGVDAAIIYSHELDRSPKTTGKDGAVTGQLLARQQAQYIKKAIFESTPTIEGSIIHSGYLAGTQHEAHFNFTCCDTYNPIRFEHLLEDGTKAGIVWQTDDDGAIKYDTVRYACASCGTLHDEDEIKKIIYQRGEKELKLVAKYPDRIIASVHAGWYLLTPFGTMKSIVQDYDVALRAGHDLLASFYNLKLGLPYTIPGSKLEFDKIMERAVDIKKLVVPYGAVMLTAGVDVQKYYLAVQIIAWGKDEQKQILYYDHIEGDTSTSDPWNKLFTLLDQELDTDYSTSTNKVTMPIEAIVCDTGGVDTHFYYTMLRGKPSKYIAGKGSTKFESPLFKKARHVDVNYGNGKVVEKGIALRELGVSQAKVYLYNQLALATKNSDKGYTTFGRFLPPSYFKELCSEQLIVTTNAKGDRNVYSFEKIQTRNEALDTYIYAYIGYIMTAGHSHEYLDYDTRFNRLKAGMNLIGDIEIIEDKNKKPDLVTLKSDRILCKMIKTTFISSEKKFKKAGEFVDLSFEEYLIYAKVGAVAPHDSNDKIQKIKLFKEQQEKVDNESKEYISNTTNNNTNKGSFLI